MTISSSNNKLHGFTLIELLIVIGVIGILAASILTIIKPFEQFAKTRDAGRKQALRELANGLERYMVKNRIYPITSGWYSSEPGDNPSAPNGPANNGDWIPGLLLSNEITRLPRDPKGGASSNPTCTPGGWKRAYLYNSDSTGSCYKLLSHCAPEAAGALSPTDPFYDETRKTWAWMVCSPEGSTCCPPNLF